MSFTTGRKDSLYGLDNDHPILRSPEERKKKRYGISHHMCIHDWEQQVQEENNRLVNGDKDSTLNEKNDSVNDTQDLIDLTSNIDEVVKNGHQRLCRNTSEFLMSETSDDCDDSVEKALPSFCDRYSRFVQSMADLEEVKFKEVEEPPPIQKVDKQHKHKPPQGAKPPIAPKPLLFRTQSDDKYVNPSAKALLRPRSGTANSEPPLGEENQHHPVDNMNKSLITGFSKTKPVIKHVKPPMPAPRTSVLSLKPDSADTSHTLPLKEAVSPNVTSDENRNKEPSVEINRNEAEIVDKSESEKVQSTETVQITEKVQVNGNEGEMTETDQMPGQRRYGVIEPINHKEPSHHNDELTTTPVPAPRNSTGSCDFEAGVAEIVEPTLPDEPVNRNELMVPSPAPRLSTGSSDLGSRHSANLEELSASSRCSEDLDDKRVSAESYGRYSLDLDNLNKVDTGTDEEHQRLNHTITVINNELNDTFNEDIPSQPPHNKYGKRAQRESVRNLHVPVRERAAKFEQIAADIRASTDMTPMSRNSSMSSSQSHSPLGSPRVSRQMSFSWERQIEHRLRVNRSRDSSQLSSSTSSTSRSGSSRGPVSRSMSSGSAFSDYRQSYSSDDVSFEPVYEVKPMAQFPEEDSPMLPDRCPIERDDLWSARLVQRTRSEPYRPPDDLYENLNGNEPSQDELYENIDDHRRSKNQSESFYNHPHEDVDRSMHAKVQKQDSTYAVYLDEEILEKQFPSYHMRVQEGYHSDGYHGDLDHNHNGADEAASKSADELGDGPAAQSTLKTTQSISRRRRQAIRKSTKGGQAQSFDAGIGSRRVGSWSRPLLRHTDSEPARKMRLEDDDVAMAMDDESGTPSSKKEELYDEVATLRRELLQESRKLQEANERLARTDITSPDEEFIESGLSEDSESKARKKRDGRKSRSSFEYFQPLFLGSKEEVTDKGETDAVSTSDAKRTNGDLAQVTTSNGTDAIKMTEVKGYHIIMLMLIQLTVTRQMGLTPAM